MATISNNDIIINYKLGDTSGLNSLISKFDKLSNEEEDVIAKAKELVEELRKMGATGKGAGDGVNDGLKKAKGGAGELISSLKSVGAVMGVAFSTAAIVNFGKAALEVTGKFQTMAAVLKNTLGSESAAQAALVRIQELAAKTPFSVEQLTASFVKLANQGFQPTNAQIIRLGDLAASTGKDFNMLAEAIIDAQVGEFERLKEFGIRAKKEGDQVTFTFKGVETTVRNTSTAIRDYIVSLGDVAGVTGAMKAQSETLEGAVSNLGDSWDMFLNSIGNSLAPIYKKAIQVTAGFLTQLKDLFQTEEGKLQERQGTSYNLYVSQLEKASDEAISNLDLNSSKRLAIAKKETESLQKEAEKTKLAYDLAMSRRQDEKGGGFAIQQKREMEAAKAALAEAKKIQVDLEAMNQAALDVAKKRAEEKRKNDEQSASASADAAKKMEKEFANRKRLLELEKQYQTLLLEAGGNPNARLAAEKQYYDGLARLQQEYANKGIKITQLEIDTTKLQRDKAAQDLTDAEAKQQLQTLDGIKAFNDKRNAEMEKAAKAEEERRTRQMNATKAANEAELEAVKDLEARKAEARQELQQQVYDFIVTNTNAIFELQSQYAAAEMAQKNRQFDEEIRLADGNVQKITEIEEKRRQAEKEYREKEFRANQMQAIANAVFTAAPYIIKYTSGLPVTAGNLALTLGALAAQTGFILAQPMPEFAKGVENFEGGPAIVGEQGRELVRTEKGLFLTPDKATMTYLPKGSDVITAPKTRELLQGNSTFLNRQNQWTAIDTAPIAQAIKAIPVQSLEISERGLERYVTKGNRTTKILNKKRGANL